MLLCNVNASYLDAESFQIWFVNRPINKDDFLLV